jgi:hemoglobin/transferrin/lactoferrin receptor protein
MTFVGEQRVDSSYDDYVPSAYATFDFTSEWRPTDNVLLSLGIYNIFDKRYYNFQDLRGVSSSDLDLTRYSQPERNIQASIKFKF